MCSGKPLYQIYLYIYQNSVHPIGKLGKEALHNKQEKLHLLTLVKRKARCSLYNSRYNVVHDFVRSTARHIIITTITVEGPAVS